MNNINAILLATLTFSVGLAVGCYLVSLVYERKLRRKRHRRRNRRRRR